MTGVYGVGKTHFLEYINNIALKDNWAVSFLEFDSNSLPLNKPKLLYEEIIRSFQYKNGDFRDFLTEVAFNPEGKSSARMGEDCRFAHWIISAAVPRGAPRRL